MELNSEAKFRILKQLTSEELGILRQDDPGFLSALEAEEYRASLEGISEEERWGPDKPKILSFSELLNLQFLAIPWDVEGLFESGTINMVSAPPNQYKSWIVQHMAICMAQGKDAFGQFKTKPQKILIINEEDNLRMIKDRSLKMIEGKSDLGIHFLVMSGFKIDKDSVIRMCIKAKKIDVSFIIFDSLRSVHEANENDSQEMQKIMDHFKYLTKRGITVLFTHHNRKKAFGKFKDEFGEESRGSTAINAAVHGHISCEEITKDNEKYLLITQRKLKCAEKIKPFLVKINSDIATDKMSFHYAGEYDASEQSFKKNKDNIVKIIEGSDMWLSKNEIVNLAGSSLTTVNVALRELTSERLVQSRTKKDLDKDQVQINDPNAKHNAKFYFRSDKSTLDEFVEDLQTEIVF
ncbi:MAG: hypothetical protein RL641_333 [Candidatus Parcubacteria bacterium]|jgi:hypothetical protein